jgi:hypothetical protein
MRVRYVSIIIAIVFVVSILSLAIAEEVKHEYVGAKKCKICHKKDGIHAAWLETKHATAWDSLSAEDQKKEGIKAFYTTGTDAKGELLTGIQCEACHGAGADYKKKSIMEDREKSVANGLLIPDEKTCLKCHNEKAPTAALAATAKGFDYEKMKAKGVHAVKAAEEAEKKK